MWFNNLENSYSSTNTEVCSSLIVVSKLSPHEAPPMAVDPETIRDVYLGGSCGLTTWRTAIAAPILRYVLLS